MSRRRTRGQLVVGAALALALLFVSVAFVLNGVLFTAHESQAALDPSARDPAVVASEAERAVAGALPRVNAGNATNYSVRSAALDGVVESWERAYTREHARSGASVTLSVRGLTRGVRIADGNASRPLTAADGSDDWTLATDVTGIRETRVSLAADSLAATGDPAPTRLVADNGSATWTATVTNDTSDAETEVTVAAPTGTTTCATTESTVDLDVVDGTVDGADCPALSLPEALGTPYTLRVANGTNATGTYTLTVANATALPTANYDHGSDPTFTPVAYGATVSIGYAEDGLTYRATRDVLPASRSEGS